MTNERCKTRSPCIRSLDFLVIALNIFTAAWLSRKESRERSTTREEWYMGISRDLGPALEGQENIVIGTTNSNGTYSFFRDSSETREALQDFGGPTEVDLS